MDERTVTLTRRCNLGCATCSGTDVPEAGSFGQLRERVRVVARLRPDVLLLAGGEPLLLRRLAELVRTAREAGAGRVLLRTNGLLLSDASRVRELVAAGLDGARVFLPAGEDAPYARFTGLPDGLARLRVAIRNLAAAGREVSFRHVVERATHDDLPGVVTFAARSGVAAPTVRLEMRGAPHAVDLAAWAGPFAEAVARAGAEGVALRFDPASAPPPCLLPGAELVVAAWQDVLRAPLGAMGHREGCAACALAERCPVDPAPWVQAGGLAAPRPLRADHPLVRPDGGEGRGAPRQEERSYFVDLGQGAGWSRTVRLPLTWRCNHRCAMCTYSRRQVDVTDAELEETLARAEALGVDHVLLAGGEPTLHPRLVALVARARAAGARRVEIQTNGVLLDESRVRALAAAGLTTALVSLHAGDAATYAAVTGDHDGFPRVQAAVDALLAAGVGVSVNAVVSTLNMDALDAVVRLVARRWSGRPGFEVLQLHVVRANAEEPEAWRHLLPPYPALAPRLRAAMDLARALEVEVWGLASDMGLPWCVLDGDPKLLGASVTNDEPSGPSAREWFVSAPVCATCRFMGRCPGVPRGYAALHGFEGIGG